MIMSKVGQEELMYLSSFLSKKMKTNFGKGPETCVSIVKHHTIYVQIRNFITPAEEVLKNKNQLSLAIQFRTAIMETIFQEYKTEVFNLLNMELESFYYDWDYNLNHALVMFVSNKGIDEIKSDDQEILLKEKVMYVSSKVHKEPSEVHIQKINSNMYVARCQEAMCEIGKVLYKKGLNEVLYEYAYDLKGRFFENTHYLEAELNRKVEAHYVLWDFHQNINYMVFIFR
ncbi:hypothetical protein BTR23_02940 [Alkalihalophilus pseudofirmus]|nr:hypothetical protein BTR23_02940 [Alkalihalophilus pseudofirmus]